MPRRSRFAVPTDPTQFSALQVQPAAALRIGASALATCLRNQLVDWRLMQRDHHTAIVMVGIRLEYLRDFEFFAASQIDVDAGLVGRRGGRFLELDCRLDGPDGTCARLSILNRPVQISDTEALDAMPADLDQGLLDRLQPDEHDPAPIVRPLVDRLAALEGTAKVVDEGDLDFTVSRADCEHADQWAFVRLPEFLALGRERLVFAGADLRVKAGLREPMKRFYAEYRRPMFLGDDGVLVTKAYADAASVTFVHEVRALTPAGGADGTVCAVALEEFDELASRTDWQSDELASRTDWQSNELASRTDWQSDDGGWA